MTAQSRADERTLRGGTATKGARLCPTDLFSGARASSGAASSHLLQRAGFSRHASCFGHRCARGRARSAPNGHCPKEQPQRPPMLVRPEASRRTGVLRLVLGTQPRSKNLRRRQSLSISLLRMNTIGIGGRSALSCFTQKRTRGANRSQTAVRSFTSETHVNHPREQREFALTGESSRSGQLHA